MSSQFVTCKFKIHNPSKRKRNILNHALEQYTLGYKLLLEWAMDHENALAVDGKYIPPGKDTGKYTDKSIAKHLPGMTQIPVELHSSAKDSLARDVAGNLASYFALKEEDPNTSFPVSRDFQITAFPDALEWFADVGSDVGDYSQSKDRLTKMARGSVMPLYFARADGASQNRNFSLLWNKEKGQLLATLYLLPNGHEDGKPLGIKHNDLIRLDTGETYKSNSKSAIIVPLEVGRNGWHDYRFLDPSRSDVARVQTAYLVRDDEREEYFLHISFAIDCPIEYKPEAYVGLDKGILFTAAYAIVDGDGSVIDLGHFDDELRALQIKHGRERERLAKNGRKVTQRHYKTKAYDNILHVLANKLIELALKHKAQIVVESLNVNVKGGRVVSRFRKFDKILTYKCKLAGVPFRPVFAANSSVICHKCGNALERNDRLVICPACGYQGHSDDNASVNVARRAMYRKKDWEKKGGYWAFHRSFSVVENEAGFSTKIDSRQDAVTHPVSGNGRGPGTYSEYVQGAFEALYAVSG